MLYLEDYLEMIEHLPQELRDRFTEMRELDLSVQNNMDELEKRVKVLFGDCKRFLNNELPPNADLDFQGIRKEYYKTLEDADEKVHLANQMYELVDKYLRRLDTELHKFKCELEADNKGITEVLEKRSLELDTPLSGSQSLSQQQKENRYEKYSSSRPRSEKRRDSTQHTSQTSYPEKRERTTLPTSLATNSSVNVEPSTNVRHSIQNQVQVQNQVASAYTLGHIGAGGAIAAAASQAIAATQQMQQGRRTASLKASYEAINNTGGVNVHEFGIGRELAGAAQTAIQQAMQQQEHANNKKKQKKWSGSSGSHSSVGSTSTSTNNAIQQQTQQQSAASLATQQLQQIQNSTSPNSPALEISSSSTANNVAEATDGEWTYDPNEPRYCLCNQVSYGDMVACDNEDCPSEWFHYPCVGITAPPKGKWYCPQCTASMRRRGGRKN